MTLTGQLYRAIFLMLFKFLKVSTSDVAAEDTDRMRMQLA